VVQSKWRTSSQRGEPLKPKVYVESSVISYLTGRPSRDSIVAANQSVTKQWWQSERSDVELFISQIVLLEIEAGDVEVARLRLDLARQIPLLNVTPECDLLAERLLVEGALPKKATRDAFHIATAAFHRMNFLLTWNCRHIANDILMRKLGSIMRAQGYISPEMCTPAQFLDRRVR